jgi:hypothetical protein
MPWSYEVRTSKGQATNADIGDSTSDDDKIVLLEARVDIYPAGPGANFDALLVLGELYAAHADEVDGKASICIAEASVTSMAATFDSKVAPFLGDGLHDQGDIFSGGRLYATSRSDV